MSQAVHTNCDVAKASTHCVFRCGANWMALPVLAVREVLPAPRPVFVPGMSAVFLGLCHVRSEFVPVLKLSSVLPLAETSRGGIMLILDDADGPWAMCVDEVSALRTLEMSDSPESYSAEVASVVIGWATVEDNVVQVLDQSAIRQFAERQLADVSRSSKIQNNVSARDRMEMS